MFRASKLYQSLSTCGPSATEKAHVAKDRADLFRDLRNRVDGALALRATRQGHVQPFGAQTFVQRGVSQPGFLGGDGRVNLVLQGVQLGTGDLAFFGRHLAQLAHFQGDFALLADRLHADIFQRRFVSSPTDCVQIFCSELVHVGPFTSHRFQLANAGQNGKRARSG